MATKINLRLIRSGAMPSAPPATSPTDPLEGFIVHPADTADSDFDEAIRLAWNLANAYDRAQRDRAPILTSPDAHNLES